MAMASFIVLSAAVIGATAHWTAEILLAEYGIRQQRKAAGSRERLHDRDVRRLEQFGVIPIREEGGRMI